MDLLKNRRFTLWQREYKKREIRYGLENRMGKRLYPMVAIFLLMQAGYGAAYGGDLSGVVEEEGAPLAQVEILLVNTETRVVLDNTLSDANGRFRFSVESGVFDLGAFRTGYSAIWTKNVAMGEADQFIRMELIPEAFSEEPDTDISEDCD